MSDWSIFWKKPTPKPTPPPITHRVDYAGHIRGRITRNAGGRLYMQVRNGDTVIAYDGPFATLEHALHETERVVAAARVSWMYGFGKKGLVR